jgi:hypothetical protein
MNTATQNYYAKTQMCEAVSSLPADYNYFYSTARLDLTEEWAKARGLSVESLLEDGRDHLLFLENSKGELVNAVEDFEEYCVEVEECLGPHVEHKTMVLVPKVAL